MKKSKTQTVGKDDRQAKRDAPDVKPTQCIWTDIDTNRKYLIQNKGNNAVYVNSGGQIPSRFNQDVTGVANYRER